MAVECPTAFDSFPRAKDGIRVRSVELDQGFGEVAPVGVGDFDQLDFPGAFPFLDTLFAEVGAVEGGVGFVPDQPGNIIFAGVAGHGF